MDFTIFIRVLLSGAFSSNETGPLNAGGRFLSIKNIYSEKLAEVQANCKSADLAFMIH
jgi:hypothetical protein